MPERLIILIKKEMHFDCNYNSSKLHEKFKKPLKDVSKTGDTDTVLMSCVEPRIQRCGGDHYKFAEMKMVEIHCEGLSEAPTENLVRIYKFTGKLV